MTAESAMYSTLATNPTDEAMAAMPRHVKAAASDARRPLAETPLGVAARSTAIPMV
jgi:hypothetical protein